MKKVIPFILLLILITVIFGYYFIKNVKKEASVDIDDKINIKVIENDYLKAYYEKMLLGDYPQFIEFDRKISFTDTTNSLLLYKKYRINFDSVIAFDNAQVLFENEWKFLNSENEQYSNEERIDQKVHVSYELIQLAKELSHGLKNDIKNEIINFYIEYVNNELNKNYINQNVEMLIKNRLAYIGNFFEEQQMGNNILVEINDKLENIILEDFNKLQLNLLTVEDYINIMYAISGLDALRYEDKFWNRNDIKEAIVDFVKSKKIDSYTYYEQAIFLNKFISIYPDGINPELKNKVNYIFQSFMNDNTTLSNSLKFICLDLFYNSNIGYDESKYYIEQLEHDKSYGFYLPKNLELTMENLYFSFQISTILGINFDLISMYFDELERTLTPKQEIVSFSEMYYFNLLLKNTDNNYPVLEKINSKSVGKAKDYIKKNEVNDENFIHNYYAFKIMLDSGETEFVEDNLSYLENFVEETKNLYPNEPSVHYIGALYQELISKMSNFNLSERELNNIIANLPDNPFYLNTVYKYIEILIRKDFTLSYDVKNEVYNRIKGYKTINGFSPEIDMGYTTILSTYYGLTITGLLEND